MALALDWGAPLTVDDLRDAPDDGHRYELLDGSLVVTPAPGIDHQRCVVALTVKLVAAAGPDLQVLVAPFDWVVSRGTRFQPDVLVARNADLGSENLQRPPVLAVEVLSPSTRLIDLGAKRLAYASAGLPAYWVVDPEVPSLTALRLQGAELVDQAYVEGEQAYVTNHPFEVRIVPAELLTNRPPGPK